MTRNCDNCKKTIPLGENHVEISFIGIKQMEELFKVTHLDFCSLVCLVEFWIDKRFDAETEEMPEEKRSLTKDCFRDCHWIKYFDFVNPDGLMTFQEWFRASIEGVMRRDKEIANLKSELAKIKVKEEKK